MIPTPQRDLPLQTVRIADPFWSAYLEKVRTVVIPYQWRALNDQIPDAAPSYVMRNFEIAALLTRKREGATMTPQQEELTALGHGGYVFQDSDVAKWLEAVGYALAWHPDPALEALADGAIEKVCLAQQPDGYLNTYYIINGLDRRFTNVKDHHELYCLGHFVEAAVAYCQGTGKRRLLDAVLRYVDLVDKTFGPEEGKLRGYPGHPVLEMALVRLYEMTGEQRHLELARYFVTQRGQSPLFFEEETRSHGNPFHWANSPFRYQYYQAGLPLTEQQTAQGHAVRAAYLFSGMTDVARHTGDARLLEASDRLWDDVVHRQMYITGAIGQAEHGEAFTYDYDLPNDTVYGETCASIGLAFWAKRMLKLRLIGEYADTLERALYNGIISGMSQDGTRYFYVNPLEALPRASREDVKYRHVKTRRQKWFGCACCPPNLARLIASLGSYLYTAGDDMLAVHLYAGSETALRLAGTEVRLRVETGYPWDGTVSAALSMDRPARFALALRIPSWCERHRLQINGEAADAPVRDGYQWIDREWHPGDRISLQFEMPAVAVRCDPRVRQNVGRVAVMRGPVVYCLEECDNGGLLNQLQLDGEPGFEVRADPRLPGGIPVIEAHGARLSEGGWPEGALYSAGRAGVLRPQKLLFVPYFFWANREEGEMTVWVRDGAAEPGRAL